MTTKKRDKFGEIIYRYVVLSCERITKPYENYFKSELSMKQLQAMCTLHTYGRMTMSELACRLEVTKQEMTQIINSLVDKSYVKRSYDPKDRRIVRVANTRLGMKHIDDGDDAFIERMRVHMSVLNDKDYNDLINAMTVINRILPLVEVNNYKNKVTENKVQKDKAYKAKEEI